ncbi:MAG: helix-turn-helix domain-containing protein [Hydrogenophilus thermoluteolus]|jgi:Fis family transcriptional regulator|uniref:helix-turn-helix domain-containing protein n=1 Tax=Hydrogenophilus thermoluteolus TaxID=297 RepID=UPI000EEC1111|nr:helix-turn-helix domain-containing protein [Hydrogenophilus thermoluteolus]HCO77596.1 Fis family transcriptional regulator [Rhodocyclaceae bacterium]MBW7655857.1 Fis family transcriptional regulator [Hydrogenophilus thermoluteolus]GLW59775.1 DNA-binding protein [Hydrogenophilus thermoluteolus]HNQ48094.1 helix-turn-helix domain-containing protein [Hydrogenophilus thermoluteolus]HNU19276.1 helix-turn-helix domain-containing protein [Hydrogenophilus thermoluteolus]
MNAPQNLSPHDPLRPDDTLCIAVKTMLDRYFVDLDGAPPSDLHAMVMKRVERTLFEYVLIRTHGNITRASELLGVTRNTLRRKLKEHDLYPNA